MPEVDGKIEYEKVGWANGNTGGTPMSAKNFDQMDQGIYEALSKKYGGQVTGWTSFTGGLNIGGPGSIVSVENRDTALVNRKFIKDMLRPISGYTTLIYPKNTHSTTEENIESFSIPRLTRNFKLFIKACSITDSDEREFQKTHTAILEYCYDEQERKNKFIAFCYGDENVYNTTKIYYLNADGSEINIPVDIGSTEVNKAAIVGVAVCPNEAQGTTTVSIKLRYRNAAARGLDVYWISYDNI